nr:hypothetical protein 80 - common tobacco chloroplast [Nicotiana tabacum]prf//1211235M ORF 80 [Nicotiana tabacum]
MAGVLLMATWLNWGSCRYYCRSIDWRTGYSINIKNFSYRRYSRGVLQNMCEPHLMEKSNSMRIWFIRHVHVMGIPPFYVL